MSIYQCIKTDDRHNPQQRKIVHEAETEKGAIKWLENNGGGIYRNILHNFDCSVVGAIIRKEVLL